MKFTKLFGTVGAFLLLSAGALAGTLKVGATPVPHAEILELIKPDLKKQGVELKIVEFTDYVTPNLALSDKEIDANFFQHKPYLDKFSEERKLTLSSIANIHVEPLGLYSKKVKSINNLKNGDTIAIPSDPSNGGRALILLHSKGIITLKDPKNLFATEFDIVKNPKKLKFKPTEVAQLPRILPDVTAAIINGNYALQANLSPAKDSLILEGKESPYANILVVRKGDEKKEDIQKLLKALRSEKVKKYINEKYSDGSVVPAF